jgi:hypothetical protein
MNGTTMRTLRLRTLGLQVAHARSAVAQQTIEREATIRQHGGAHPRSIRAGRRLQRTSAAYRDLLAAYRRRTREDTRQG